MRIPIFGNGDVDSPEKALAMRDAYGVDGVMIGRAAIGYPWIFDEIKHFMKTGEHMAAPSIDMRVAAAREHLDRSITWKGTHLGIVEMRRHYANYFRGVPHFKEFRTRLVTSMELEELYATLSEIKQVFAEVV